MDGKTETAQHIWQYLDDLVKTDPEGTTILLPNGFLSVLHCNDLISGGYTPFHILKLYHFIVCDS